MIIDKSRMFLTNVHTILQLQPISPKVQEWDVVWFMDGKWYPIDGTLEHNKKEYNWGLAYHVDQEKGLSKIWYYGDILGCLDLITEPGLWYADKNGKLTKTPTLFYVGYSHQPKTLCLELYDTEFITNARIDYPYLTDEWANLTTPYLLTLTFLDPHTNKYIKWGKQNSTDPKGYLLDIVNNPPRYNITKTMFENDMNERLTFNLASTINIPSTCSIEIGGSLDLGIDYQINILSKLDASIIETITEGNLFILDPEVDLVPDQRYFEIEFLKPYDDVIKNNGMSLDIFVTDANTLKCNKTHSVFYFWFTK